MGTTTATRNSNINGDILKTIATLLGILVILFGMASGYGTLQQRLDDACARLEKVEAKVEGFQVSDTETKVQLGRIETDLAYIRTWIERQERGDE